MNDIKTTREMPEELLDGIVSQTREYSGGSFEATKFMQAAFLLMYNKLSPELSALKQQLNMLHGRPFSMRDYGAMESRIDTANAEISELPELIKGYEEWGKDVKRLSRELDVDMFGEEGAARQPSLCDIASSLPKVLSVLRREEKTFHAMLDELNKLFSSLPHYAYIEVRKILDKYTQADEEEQTGRSVDNMDY